MGVEWKLRWGRRPGSQAGGETGPAGRFTGRLVGTLFFGVFFGLGVVFLVLIGRETWRVGETYGWAERSCEILHSQVVRAGGDDPYRPEVRFQAQVAGETVTGSQVQRRELSYESHGEARERLAPYPVGAVVPCFTSSAREAVLERGPLWFGLWALLPMIFVAIGGAGLVAAWRPEQKDRFGRSVPKALGERATGATAARGRTPSVRTDSSPLSSTCKRTACARRSAATSTG